MTAEEIKKRLDVIIERINNSIMTVMLIKEKRNGESISPVGPIEESEREGSS